MKQGRLVEKIALSYLLIALAAVALASVFFPVRGWGLSLPVGYPLPVAAGFFAVSLLGAVPLVRARLARFLEPSTGPGPVMSAVAWRHVIVSGLAAGAAAFCLTVRCPLMGDGIDHIYNYFLRTGEGWSIHRHYHFFSTVLLGWHSLLFGGLVPGVLDGAAAPERAFLVWSLTVGLGAGGFVIGLLRLAPVLAGNRPAAKPLLALVLTSGTMVLFSGFIEVTVMLGAALVFFLLAGCRLLEKPGATWAVSAVFFLCLGFHASAVALLPALVWTLYAGGRRAGRSRAAWLLGVITPAAVFLFLVSRLVGLEAYFHQFVSGVETLGAGPGQSGEAFAYAMLSPAHLSELANVVFLHNPLNYLLLAWIVYGAVRFRRKLKADSISVFLFLALSAYLAELVLFHAFLGVFRDWDIFSPLGILLPCTAFRFWVVAAPEKMRSGTLQALAALLPLAAAYAVLWGVTVHTPERIIRRMIDYARNEELLTLRGRKFLASNISIYCTSEDYLPGFVIDFMGEHAEARQYILSRLKTIEAVEKVLSWGRDWADQLDPLDYSNLGIKFESAGRGEEAVYYYRKGYQAGPWLINLDYNLASYYLDRELKRAFSYYYILLPADFRQKLEKVMGFEVDTVLLRHAEKQIDLVRSLAAKDVFRNGLICLERGFPESAELEFKASLELGMDSVEVRRALESLR
ncbi:MAG: hypothetical protein JXQ83_00135 [Candidatus Glassbacteria bacterium]|nr:hypothetical protein [Candidatus Glassbacteria bacterium]